MKKSAISIILAFALAISGCTYAISESQSENVSAIDLTSIKPYESALSLCWQGDALYILGSYGVYQWLPGDNEPSTLFDLSASAQYQYVEQKPDDVTSANEWSQAIRFVFSDNQALYGLHPYSGEICQITKEGMKSIAQLPDSVLYAETDGETFIREIKGIALSSQRLFVLLGTDDYNEYEKTELFSFDLSTREVSPCSPNSISAITAGGAGKLVLYTSGEDSAIWQYDVVTDSLERPLFSLQDAETPSGLAWYSDKDGLVHYTANRVTLTSMSGESYTKAYLPVAFSSVGTAAACSNSGIYAYPYGNHVLLRDVSIAGEVSLTILRVLGYVSPNLLIEFSIENPQIAVVILENSADEYLQQATITADSSVDVFVVSANDNYADMKAKGFAATLNGRAELVSKAKELYPAIQDVIFDGDNLLAYPLAFQPHSWTINETVWKKLGLPEYPTTYDELFAIIAHWLDEYTDEYPEYTLSDVQQGSLESLVTMLVKEYIFQREESNTRLSFDTPAFRTLMQSVIDNANLLLEENEQWGMPLISNYNQGFGSTYNDNDLVRMLLPPTINKEQRQMLSGDVELLILNAASTKQDEALQFISFYAEHLDTITRYSINPNLNDPVRNQNYESRLETLNQELESLQSRLGSADDLQRKTIQEEIDQKSLIIESVMDNEWSISKESIEIYRAVVEHLRIPYESAFLGESVTGGFAAIHNIIAQYCSDGLTTEELTAFINALDQVTYMVYMEGQ